MVRCINQPAVINLASYALNEINVCSILVVVETRFVNSHTKCSAIGCYCTTTNGMQIGDNAYLPHPYARPHHIAQITMYTFVHTAA